MASLNDVARGLLGPGANEEEVNLFSKKLVMGYPEWNKKGMKLGEVVRVLMEEVEPYRSVLKPEMMERIYREAREKIIDLAGGVTGYLDPEKVSRLNSRDKKS